MTVKCRLEWILSDRPTRKKICSQYIVCIELEDGMIKKIHITKPKFNTYMVTYFVEIMYVYV